MNTRILSLSTLAVAALALFSCAKEQDVNIQEGPQGIPFKVVAGTLETKTVFDGFHTTWSSYDKINLFHAVHGESSYINDGEFEASQSGASVPFVGTIVSPPSSGTYDWFAVYPYNSSFTAPDGTQTVNIPGAQTQTGNDSNAHLSGIKCPVGGKVEDVAFDATPSITMKNLTTVLKVVVRNKINKSITISDVAVTAPENINGDFNLDLTGVTPAWSGTGSSNITNLTIAGPSAIAPNSTGNFYMSVKPFSVPAGSSIAISISTDRGDQTVTTCAASDWSFTSGKIYTLNVDFTNQSVNMAAFKYNDSDWLTGQSITLPAGGADTELTGTTQTVAPITLSSTDGSTTTRVHGTAGTPVTYDFRVYKSGGSFTLSSTDDYIINKVVMVGSDITDANVAVSNGSYSADPKTWTGFTQDVTFTHKNPSGNRFIIKSINVFYQAATASDHILNVFEKTKAVAYDETSTTITFRKLNVDDMSVSSSNPAYTGNSVVGNTITVNFSANASSTPRDIIVTVSSASAGVDETVTITQAGAPQTINNLSAGDTGVSVTGIVQALSKKGYMISDGTGVIFVYLNAVPAVALGDNVTVSGDVEADSRALRIVPSGDASVNSSGSASYGLPTIYGKAEIDAWTANASTRTPEYVTLSGVAQGTYGIVVGGGATQNVQTYYAHASLTSISKGDFVTITGYAYNVIGSAPAELGIVATSITKDASVPALYFSDITGVAAAAASGLSHTFTAYRASGWTPSITDKPSWVTAATMNAACTTLTYSISKNSSTSDRTGVIEITLTKEATSFVYYVNITQNGDLPTATFTFSTMGYSNGAAVTSVTSDDNSNTDITLTFAQADNATNAPKYYTAGSGVRMYGDNTLTITGGTITKVVLTAAGNSYTTEATANTGTVTKSGSVETWTGSTTSLVLTAHQTSRTQTIVVTYIK